MSIPGESQKRSIAATASEASSSGIDRNRLREGGVRTPAPGRAPRTEADAFVSVSISTDGLEARVQEYRPPAEGGRSVEAADIEAALRKAGVVVKPDFASLERLAKRLAEEEDPSKIVLVRGRPPEEPSPAAVEPIGDLNNPVIPNSHFAKRTAPHFGAAGRGVDGREIPPKAPGKSKDLEVSSESNCRLDVRRGVIVSEAYGKAHVVDEDVWVEPLLNISNDHIEVLADVFPVDHMGRPIQLDVFLQELSRRNIAAPAQKNTLSSAVNRAQKSKKPQLGILAAKGIRPQDGKDGWLELLVEGRSGKAAVKDDGRVDHHDRGVYPSVGAGVDIARLHPPTMGLPGTDVFGKPIPAKRGQPLKAAAGENVEALEDGKLFRSNAAGILSQRGGVLAVTECLSVSGDVDFSTGNIALERGSVKISGAVLAGFTIDAPAHVIVGDVIESAYVTAGKDVEVRGGILMPDGGLVKAGGSVICQFATNANIEAGGDVVIAHNISNCDIKTKGRVVNSKGKGIIQGGRIVCAQGLDTNEIGSELGVATTIVVSVAGDENKELLEERKHMNEQVEKINGAVGVEDPKTCLLRTPECKRKAVAELLKVRIRAQHRIKEIDEAMAVQEQHYLQQLGSVRIVVRRVAWPGTVIKIGGRTVKLKSPAKACRFYWEKETQEIAVGALK
ncbi:MAG: DUF342 domain-containing protein [Desulfovibrionaceae bacterium]